MHSETPLKPVSKDSPQDDKGFFSDLKFVVFVWVISRIWFTIFAYLGHLSHPFQENIEGGFAGVSNWYLNVWTTFDSKYFLEIAQSGYTAKSSAFFPLYPLLLRPFGPDENAMALAGCVISNLCFAIALWLFWKLSRLQFERVLCRKMLWVLALFPAGVYSMAVYTESLFLMLSLSAFYLARTNRWVWVAPLGLLAALTRNAGPILAASLLLEWWLQHKASKSTELSERPQPIGIVAALLPAFAFIGMQLYFRSLFGGIALLETQQSFGRAASWPWIPIFRDMQNVILFGFDLETILGWSASVLTFVLAYRYRKVIPKPENLLMCGIMLMQLCYSRIWAPYTISSLRYVFATTAFSQAIALEIDRPKYWVVRMFIIVVALILSAALTYQFGIKSLVS
jgi:hypothetical protein